MSPLPLFAGMPTIRLTDIASMRVEVISFFALLFLLSSTVLFWVWNGLARDFPRLPKMSFKRSMGVTFVWSALFVLVLTMISGARELMTPGAWKKDGATYKLVDESDSVKDHQLEQSKTLEARRHSLEKLSIELSKYALKHDGRFPDNRQQLNKDDVWLSAHPTSVRFVYIPGHQSTSSKSSLLAIEPDVFEGSRLGLFTDGTIRTVEPAEIESEIRAKGVSQ